MSACSDESDKADGGRVELKDPRSSAQLSTRRKGTMVDRIVPAASSSGKGEINTNKIATITAASSPFFNQLGTSEF